MQTDLEKVEKLVDINLLEFLEKNGHSRQKIYNYMILYNDRKEVIEEYVLNCGKINCINDLFNWKDTSEKGNYWFNLYEEYNRYKILGESKSLEDDKESIGWETYMTSKEKEQLSEFDKFCYEYLDRLYNPNAKEQCSGYYLLRKMVIDDITPASIEETERWENKPEIEALTAAPHLKYLRFLHPILRPRVIKYWDKIKTLKIND